MDRTYEAAAILVLSFPVAIVERLVERGFFHGGTLVGDGGALLDLNLSDKLQETTGDYIVALAALVALFWIFRKPRQA